MDQSAKSRMTHVTLNQKEIQLTGHSNAEPNRGQIATLIGNQGLLIILSRNEVERRISLRRQEFLRRSLGAHPLVPK